MLDFPQQPRSASCFLFGRAPGRSWNGAFKLAHVLESSMTKISTRRLLSWLLKLVSSKAAKPFPAQVLWFHKACSKNSLFYEQIVVVLLELAIVVILIPVCASPIIVYTSFLKVSCDFKFSFETSFKVNLTIIWENQWKVMTSFLECYGITKTLACHESISLMLLIFFNIHFTHWF